MKKLTFKMFMLVLCTTGIVLYSCNKDEDDVTEDALTDVTTAADNSTAESLFADLFDQADQGADEAESTGKTNADTCKTVTVVMLDTTTNKREITIDFGTGCTGLDGRVRKGKIIVTLTGKHRESGSSLVAVPQDFYVNDYKIEGTKTVSNNGRNADSNYTYTITVVGGKITFPDDTTVITREATRTREWAEGDDTPWPDVLDDVYLITGSSSGTNRVGSSFTTNITTELRKEIGCKWIVSGVIELTPSGKTTRVIDYGDGTCDNKAHVTVGSFEKDIILR
ncbi:hypothetical protein JYU23_00445 [bacterium AH-315-C07]|nr:hypothetical protein [bacterium AH-315-C07]